jgi:16S rRNA (adenine1518-N6/adenine1519-N6)-dimethyltransferase
MAVERLHGHLARKRFGQNFLRDEGIITAIIEAIDPQPEQHCLEIGPGQGALTFPLLKRLGKLTAIELDRDLIAWLGRKSANLGELNLIEADALEVDLRALAGAAPLRIIGNFPYNISSPLVFRLLDQLECWQDVHGMLQKEVVERMAAGPGSKVFGRLSVMVQARAKVTHVLAVPPHCFEPAPQVDSAIVRLTPLPEQPSAELLKALDRIVRAAFQARRKQLANALKGTVAMSLLEAVGVSPHARAEEVSVASYLKLSELALGTG